MPAVPFIAALAIGSGTATAIGTAIVGMVGATVSTAVATAIGSGVISAGITAAQGGKASDILKSAVLGGVTSYVGASIASSVTSSITAAATEAGYTSIAGSIGKIAGSMASGGVQSAVSAALTGKDPIKALITGGLTAGLASGVMIGVNEVTSKIPGFNDLAKDYGAAGAATQRAVNAGLAAGVLGKNTDKAIVNSVLSSMLGAGKDYIKAGITDLSSTLKTAYDNATKTGDALESNGKRQEEIVKDYQATADSINNERATIQANLDKYNESKAAYDRGEIGVEEVNNYAKLVNDAVPAYEEKRAAVETKLATLSTELDTLKTQIPTLEKTFTDQKTELDNSVAAFQKQEEANAQQVAKVFNDTVAAKTEVEQALGAPLNQEQLDALLKTGDVAAAAKDYIDIKTTDLEEAQAAALAEGYRFDPNDPEIAAQFLGVKDEAATLAALQSFADARATTMQEATDLYTQTYADIYGSDADIPAPTDEDLLAFMPQIPTDVSGIPADYQGVAEDIVKGRIQDQFSQNLGFEDYADRSFAQESLGEERPDSEYWGQFKDTSGVESMAGSDVAPVQLGATDEATTLIPQSDANDLAQLTDQGVDTNEQTADQFGFDTLGQTAALPADQVAVMQPDSGADVVGQPTLSDLGVNTDVADVTSDIPGAQTSPVTDSVNTAIDLPPLEGGADLGGVRLSTESDTLSAFPDMLMGGSYRPPAVYPESLDAPGANTVDDIGLRSLVTSQQDAANTDSLGLASLTDRNLSESTKPDLAATAQGTATNSALTDRDPTKTIGTSILDDESEDVRGGIKSGALYSGTENEVGASDTLAAKYLNEPDKTAKTVEDVGLTSRVGTGNDTTTLAESDATGQALGADSDRLNQFVDPLRTNKTTLPISQEPVRATSNLGNTMDEYDDLSIDDYVQQYFGGTQDDELLTPDGVDESFLDRLSPADRERYLAMQDPNYVNPLEGLAPQDLGISQGNMDEFNQNFNPEDGFSSGYQTVGTNKVMIHDDGTASVIDPTTGESSYLTGEQVKALIKNGTLNSAKSGYVAATGGTGNTPGGSLKPKAAAGGSKITDKIVDALLTPKNAALLLGGALGAAGGAKGIDPMGLRSIATGTGGQRVQTGAKGTGGKGSVKYFEKKAAGGSIKGGLGYLKSAHDGMEDKINATIDNKRPAKLSGGEFVVPADVVSHLGNGNSEAGAKQLYALMKRVRKARTGTANQGKQINPKKYLPR